MRESEGATFTFSYVSLNFSYLSLNFVVSGAKVLVLSWDSLAFLPFFFYFSLSFVKQRLHTYMKNLDSYGYVLD